MQADEWKCVMVIDKELPVGVIANTDVYKRHVTFWSNAARRTIRRP